MDNPGIKGKRFLRELLSLTTLSLISSSDTSFHKKNVGVRENGPMKNENKRHKINILYLVPTSHVNLSNALSIFGVEDYHITFILGKIITSPFISTFRIGILSATTTLFLPSMCLDGVSVAAAILDDLVFWYQEVCTQQTMLLS